MSMYGKYPKVKDKDGNLVEQVGVRPVVDCSKDERLTVQADRDAADINRIMARVEKGFMPDVRADGRFEDISYWDGLQDAIMKVQDAQEAFMELPANVRERFENSPVKLVEFLGDDRNRQEAEELGLVEKPRPAPATAPAGIPAEPGGQIAQLTS